MFVLGTPLGSPDGISSPSMQDETLPPLSLSFIVLCSNHRNLRASRRRVIQVAHLRPDCYLLAQTTEQDLISSRIAECFPSTSLQERQWSALSIITLLHQWQARGRVSNRDPKALSVLPPPLSTSPRVPAPIRSSPIQMRVTRPSLPRHQGLILLALVQSVLSPNQSCLFVDMGPAAMEGRRYTRP